jgi:two-component system response regulator AtoC
MTAGATNTRILIVDDDQIIVESLGEMLRLEGFDVQTARSLGAALDVFEQSPIELLLTDINMPDGDGFELLHTVRKRFPETVAIMMTGYGTIDSAVEAIKMGAYDYLTKPIVDEDLLLCIQRALNQQALLRENRDLKRQLDQRFGLKNVVGHDHRMLKLFDIIESVAPSQITVLITGASGTGKSLLARVLHQCSPRRDKPLVEVACGAIPETLLESELFGHVRGAFTGAVGNKEGKFKAADGGTLFLDEVATASPSLQIKLLRVLQTHQFEPVGSNKTEKVDVRIVLATNADLETEVAAGRFREDLYYRINVVTLELPSLAERVADIYLLAKFFLERFCQQNKRMILDFDQEAIRTLQAYHWPGNVRELEHAVERAVVLCKGNMIGVEDLPPRLVEAVETSQYDNVTPGKDTGDPQQYHYSGKPLREALEDPERRIIEAALRANNWNRQLTADQLDINRTTLYKKMKRYRLSPDESFPPR